MTAIKAIGSTGATIKSLFDADPHLNADYSLYLAGLRDTARAGALAARARRIFPREHVALRAQFLIALERGDRTQALALADTARTWFPWEMSWYDQYLH